MREGGHIPLPGRAGRPARRPGRPRGAGRLASRTV